MASPYSKQRCRIALYAILFWAYSVTTSQCAEIIISDTRQLNSRPMRGSELGPITSLAFSLDDSCLVAVRGTTPVLLRPLGMWRGEYMVFELNTRERHDVAIPLARSGYTTVLSPPPDPRVSLPQDDVLYAHGLSRIEVGWLKSRTSLATLERSDKSDLQWSGTSIAPGLTSLAIASIGRTADEIWPSHGAAELWNLSPPMKKRACCSKTVGFNNAAFSSDGKVAFVGAGGGDTGPKSYRGEIQIWRAADAEQLRTMTVEGHRVNCLAFSPDGKTLVTGGSDGRVIWWDVTSGEREAELFLDTPVREPGEAFGHPMVYDCSYLPCGSIVAVAVGSWHRKAEWGEVRLIDLSTKKVIATPWKKARFWCENVVSSHNGEMLAASAFGGDIMLWSIEEGKGKN